MQVTTTQQQAEQLYNGSLLQDFAIQSEPAVKRITRTGGTYFRRADGKEPQFLYPAPKTYAPTLKTNLIGGKRVAYHERPYDPWAPVHTTANGKMKTSTTRVWNVKENVTDKLEYIASTVETVYTPEMRQRGLAPQALFTLTTYPNKFAPEGPTKIFLPSGFTADVSPVEIVTAVTKKIQTGSIDYHTVVEKAEKGLRVTNVVDGNPNAVRLMFYPADKPLAKLLNGTRDKSWDGLNARVHWLTKTLSDMTEKEHEESDWVQRAEAAITLGSYKHDGTLRCIICRKNPLDGFLTCSSCDADNGFSVEMPGEKDFEILHDTTKGKVRTGKGQAFFDGEGFSYTETDTVDFNHDRSGNGFQDDAQHESFLENKSWKGQVAGSARPIPLEEEKFCWILAAKFSGFTVKGSRAWFKAQRAAAQIAGRFILGYSCGQVSAMIPDTTSEGVKQFTGRVTKKGYWKSIASKPAPKEWTTALMSGLLRPLYPRWVTTGEQVETFQERQARRGRRKRLLDPLALDRERLARRAEKARKRRKEREDEDKEKAA